MDTFVWLITLAVTFIFVVGMHGCGRKKHPSDSKELAEAIAEALRQNAKTDKTDKTEETESEVKRHG